MGILTFLLLVILVGVVVWLAVSFVPMPAEFKRALPIIALLLLVLLLFVVVLGGGRWDIPIPSLR